MTAEELVAQAEVVQLMEVCTSNAVKCPTYPSCGRAHTQPSSKRDHEREAIRGAVLSLVIHRQITLGNQGPVIFASRNAVILSIEEDWARIPAYSQS